MGFSTAILFSLALFGASAQDVCTNTQMCPDGWIQVDGSCYQFNKDVLNWNDAQAKCHSLGAHLFEPMSDKEAMMTKTWAENEGLGDVWVGVTDSAQEGTWIYASTGSPFKLANWNSNEPNNYDHGDNADGEDCAELVPGGALNDNTCLATRNYICVYEMQGWIVATLNYSNYFHLK